MSHLLPLRRDIVIEQRLGLALASHEGVPEPRHHPALTIRRRHALGGRRVTTVLRRRVPHDGGPPRRPRCQDAVVQNQIDPRPRHEYRQPSEKIDGIPRVYAGMDPSRVHGGPPTSVTPLLDRVELVQFHTKGRHLVICGVLPHFVNDNMYGWVKVVGGEDDED